MPESNGTLPVPQKDEKGRFVAGNSGNGGRQKGARSKLGEKFLEDMLAAWQARGVAAIEAVIDERPQDFIKVVASILPKEIQAEVTQRFVARLPEPARNTDEWLKANTPRTINGTAIQQ